MGAFCVGRHVDKVLYAFDESLPLVLVDLLDESLQEVIAIWVHHHSVNLAPYLIQ